MRSTRRQFVAATAVGGLTATAACAALPAAVGHVVLLGDSIFDNGRYVDGQPSVIEQLGVELGGRGRATLLARDGAVIADVASQLAAVPPDATFLVLSVGGNDALRERGLLDRRVSGSAEVFAELAAIRARFRAAYAEALAMVRALGVPTAVCTIYDCNFEPPQKQLADAALTVFNDAIVRCAADAGVPVVDLRRIFRERADYANAIEPSAAGGAKMVRAIARVAAEHDFALARTTLYA